MFASTVYRIHRLKLFLYAVYIAGGYVKFKPKHNIAHEFHTYYPSRSGYQIHFQYTLTTINTYNYIFSYLILYSLTICFIKQRNLLHLM